MSKVDNADVISAVTNVIYSIETLSCNGEFGTAYHLAVSIQDITRRCGISQSAVDSIDKIVAVLADKISSTSEHRILN